MNYSQQAAAAFKNRKLKLTPQRLAIFQYLDGNTDHPSAEEVYRVIKEKFPNISFTTVYNVLKSIKETAMLRELTIDKSSSRFDPDTSPHHHLMCLRCGRLTDVFADFSSNITLPPELTAQHTVESLQINFYGLCARCR